VKALKAEAAERDQHVPLLQAGVETYKTLNEEVASFNAQYLEMKRANLEVAQGTFTLISTALGRQKRNGAETAEFLTAIDAGISDMRKDQMTFCMLLKGLLDEVVALRHVALRFSASLYPQPPVQSREPANGHTESAQRLLDNTKGDVYEIDDRRNRRNRKSAS
jgi:hypothetical protein